MTGMAIFLINPDGKPAGKELHHPGKAFQWSQEQMVMIGHQRVMMDFDWVFTPGFFEPIEKFKTILVIVKYGQLLDPAIYHVVDQSGYIYAGRLRHTP